MQNNTIMFESPYKTSTPPDHCCCGNPGVTVNVGGNPNSFPLTENNQIVSRTEQAARIIAAANAQGFPVFQGS